MTIQFKPKALAMAAALATASVAATAQAHDKSDDRHHRHDRQSHAQDSHHHHHLMMRGERDFHRFGSDIHHMAERAMDRLDLSREQRDRLFELRHAAEPDLRAARLEAREHRKALEELARAEKFDKEAAEKSSRALAEAQARGHLLRAQLHADMAKVLTDEQHDKLKTWREHRRERHEQNR